MNANTEELSRPVPPYIPLMTLENFAGKLKSTVVPPVIDSSLTQSMSGGMAGALMSALKFLGLIEANGKVREPLKKLVAAQGTEQWKSALASVVEPAYAEVIGDLDLLTATPAMLEECFRVRGKATGQVLEKSVRFYLAALAQMEQPISPLLSGRRPRATGASRKGTSRTAQRKNVENERKGDGGSTDDAAPPPLGARHLKLPIPGKSQSLVLTVPAEFTLEDWEFLKPIFEKYVERMFSS